MRVSSEVDLQAIKRRIKPQIARMIKSGSSVAQMDIIKFAYMFGVDPRDAPGVLLDVLTELQQDEENRG